MERRQRMREERERRCRRSRIMAKAEVATAACLLPLLEDGLGKERVDTITNLQQYH